mmetsp:Transcript_16557/g.57091  ORF Transcript_16557/g.57091 Transcript_16557/m.57091 type:complete len:106 (-) Transcript_16557:107-424(-)
MITSQTKLYELILVANGNSPNICWEHIVDYDHDDLDSSKMFLLSTGDSYFLWVGLCFIDTNSRATRSHVYAHDLLALLLKQGSSGNVIWENDETDGFWKAFELGF